MATIEPNFENICINPNDDLVLYKKEIVRSRIEKFLYAICSLDTDDLPTPLSRIEELYNCLVTGEDIPTFTPLSRAEKFVMAMLGAYDVELLPTPISRSETLMKKIATGDNNLDDVDNLQSRYEFLLAYIIKAGGFNGGSGDFYYQLTSLTSEFTTIYDTLDMPVKNAVLRGQTLVNVVKKLIGENVGHESNVWKVQGSGQVTYSYDVDKGITLSNTVDGSMVINYLDLTLFKPNTEYTLFIDVSWNGVGIIPHFTKIATKEMKLNNGLNIIKFTTISDLTAQNTCLRLGYAGTVAAGCEYTFNNITILEGDWTNVDIPYFEGMASVKMPVLTTVGKNLFDINKFEGIGIDEQGYCFARKFVDSVPYVTLKLKPNTNYFVKGTYIYDGTSSICYRVEHSGSYRNLNISFNTDATGITKIKIGSNNYDVSNPSKVEKLMLVETTLKDIYEPYKSTTVTIDDSDVLLTTEEDHFIVTENGSQIVLYNNEEVVLRGIGDVKDELNLVTGEVTQRIGEVVFDGSEDWVLSAYVNSTSFYTPLNNLVRKVDYLNSMSCDKLVVHTDSGSLYDSTLPNGISAYADWTDTYPNENWIYIKYADSEGYVEKLKQWLSQNPITVQYELAAESVKTVDLSTLDQDGKETELSTFDDITHVIVSSEGLVPTGEITVATKNATDVISVMSLRMDDISNSQRTLEGSANTQSDDIDVTMLGITDIYEQLL